MAPLPDDAPGADLLSNFLPCIEPDLTLVAKCFDRDGSMRQWQWWRKKSLVHRP